MSKCLCISIPQFCALWLLVCAYSLINRNQAFRYWYSLIKLWIFMTTIISRLHHLLDTKSYYYSPILQVSFLHRLFTLFFSFENFKMKQWFEFCCSRILLLLLWFFFYQFELCLDFLKYFDCCIDHLFAFIQFLLISCLLMSSVDAEYHLLLPFSFFSLH